MKGVLIALLCVVLTLVTALAIGAPIPGTYSGSVQHLNRFHSVVTNIAVGGGSGTYKIDDGTTGELSRQGKYGEYEVFRWKDKYGSGLAFLSFHTAPDSTAKFSGHWASFLNDRLYAWYGESIGPQSP